MNTFILFVFNSAYKCNITYYKTKQNKNKSITYMPIYSDQWKFQVNTYIKFYDLLSNQQNQQDVREQNE